MLICSIWFSAPRFWMGGGLESRCVGHVYGENGVVRRTYIQCIIKLYWPISMTEVHSLIFIYIYSAVSNLTPLLHRLRSALQPSDSIHLFSARGVYK